MSNRVGWLAVFLACSPIAAADVLRVLASDEQVVITLPVDLAMDGAALQVELDGYDVSAMATTSDGSVVLPLRSLALAPGQHYLLVLATDADGNVETVAEHTLDVYQREGAREAAQQWNVLLSGQYRAAQHPDESFAGQPRDASAATLQWQSSFDSGTWTAGGAFDVLYGSDRAYSADGNRWQLPAVLFRAGRRIGSGGVALAFGDGEPSRANLIFSGFNRRGLRLEANALEQRLSAEAFTLHAEPVTSLDADTPPFDSSSSVLGAQVTLAPLSANAEALQLSASWLDGDSTLGGAGIGMPSDDFDQSPRYGGHAWTVALDSFLGRRALWLHGEYAASNFDSDGIGAGEVARDDQARRFVAQLSSGGAIRLPLLDQWTLGFERRQVGAHFYSLGNLLLPGDLDMRQWFAGATVGGLMLDLRLLRQHTDVADAALTPHINSDQDRLSLSYSPPTLDPTSGPWRWLGVPSLTASVEQTANEQLEEDMLVAGYDLDNRQRSVSAGVDFSHERFSFGITMDQVHRDDRSQSLVVDDFVLYEPTPDTRETLFGVNVSWQPNERLMLAPQWQRSRTREVPNGARYDNDLWSLQVQASLVPEVLSVQLGWTDSRDAQRFFELPQDAQRLSSSNGNLDISYRMRTPDAVWPGVNFYLRSAYGRSALSAPLLLTQTDSQWQAMLSFELNWQREQ